LADLLDRFVCVRLVSANALDLATFQFDFDLTMAVFALHADGTIYARYGTRSAAREADRDMSLAGLRATLEGALELHAEFPDNRDALAGKRGPTPEFATPLENPRFRDRYSAELDYEGEVVRSCLHCHQLRDEERLALREAGEPMPDRVLFPYPAPQVVGLSLDTNSRATVAEVEPESAAAQAGFRQGDEIVTLAGQRVLSPADVQWVLHQAGDTDELEATVERGGRQRALKLTLAEGWRRRGDISWRPTTWDLRRMATGGLVLVDLDDEARGERDLPADSLALRVDHVGQYNEHAAAKHAGFEQNDVIVEFDGQSGRLRETDLIAYALQHRQRGERVPVVVLRGERRVPLELPMQ
jgi:hypothetical protein